MSLVQQIYKIKSLDRGNAAEISNGKMKEELINLQEEKEFKERIISGNSCFIQLLKLFSAFILLEQPFAFIITIITIREGGGGCCPPRSRSDLHTHHKPG